MNITNFPCHFFNKKKSFNNLINLIDSKDTPTFFALAADSVKSKAYTGAERREFNFGLIKDAAVILQRECRLKLRNCKTTVISKTTKNP